MDYRVIVVLIHLGCGFTFSSAVLHRVFHYVNTKMSWADAQSYCRDKYKDLATFENVQHIQKLQRPTLATTQAWIGLSDDPTSWRDSLGNAANSWRWSSTGEPTSTSYNNWGVGIPKLFKDQQYCCFLITDGTWVDKPCRMTKYFICFNVSSITGMKTYTSYDTLLPWADAQSYCRQHHKDLAVVENALEQSEMMSASGGNYWFGLYRQAWSWSDGSHSTTRNWDSAQPDQSVTEGFCVFETQGHLWYNGDCSNQFAFICYEDVAEIRQQTVRLKLRSDADLSDPAISDSILQQLSAKLQRNGYPEVKLRWTKKPEKEEKSKTVN